MGKLLVLILLSVVMGNGPALGDQAADSNHLDGNVPNDNGPRQMDGLTMLRPSNAAALATRMMNGNGDGDDDDHSNIELDKLVAYQYDTLPVAPMQSGTSAGQDPYSLSRYLSKVAGSKRNELAAIQWNRRLRDALAGSSMMEDKDYSFVAGPPLVTSLRYNGPQQQQYRHDSKLPTQMLRDLILSNEKALRFASDHNNNEKPEQLLQAARLGFMPRSYREKRRRCNVGQPNMGVKNPSFCDTDAYFGAADYSMRDVWDSAGR